MVSHIGALDLMRRTPIFTGLSDPALEVLGRHVRMLDYEPGNVVITEGTLGDMLYLIAEGAVEVVKGLETPDETILAKLERHDFFGEMCVIESVARSASIRAVEDPTELVALHTSDLYRLFRSMPEQYAILLLNISRDICRRLRRVDELYAAKAN